MDRAIYKCEYMAFDMYFCALMSLQVHPGAGTKGKIPLTPEECKDIAIDMLVIRRSLPVFTELKVGEE